MSSDIEIGASTGCFFDICPTESSLKKIRDIGFSFLELYLQANSELSEDFVNIIRRDIEVHDLKVLSVHPVIARFEHFLYSDYNRQYTESLFMFNRYLEICSFIGADYFVLHMVLNGSETSSERIIEKINRLAEVALSYGVMLGVENCPYGVFKNIDCIERYRDKLHSNVSLILDFKSVWKEKEKLIDTLKAMADKYVYSHLSSHVKGKKLGANFTEISEEISSFIKEIRSNRRYSAHRKIILETFWAKHILEIENSFKALSILKSENR